MPELRGDTAQPVGAVASPDSRISTVFVVGNSRSGTTMLARMLGRHSAVQCLQELHFAEELWLPRDSERDLEPAEAQLLAERLLHNQRSWYHHAFVPGVYADDAHTVIAAIAAIAAIEAPAGPPGNPTDGTPTPCRAHDVYSAVMAHEAAAAGKAVAVEQTPRNVFYVTELLDLLPGSRAVVLTRDPRDVMLSQKNWWRRRFRGSSDLPLSASVRQWVDYHPVTTSLLWRGGVRAGLSAAADPRVTLARFEDLVTDPTGVLEPILANLGLGLEPDMLQAPRISSSNSSDREGTGVDPTVVGRWRGGLSRSEVWLSQRITAREACTLGYEPEAVRLPPVGLALQALSWPTKTVLAVLLNRKRTKNLVSSATRRLRR